MIEDGRAYEPPWGWADRLTIAGAAIVQLGWLITLVRPLLD